MDTIINNAKRSSAKRRFEACNKFNVYVIFSDPGIKDFTLPQKHKSLFDYYGLLTETIRNATCNVTGLNGSHLRHWCLVSNDNGSDKTYLFELKRHDSAICMNTPVYDSMPAGITSFLGG